uniref:Uncharacterized protein n=1 Tax=Daphnia magna TaxID=35525 RepID=A0A0P6CZT3_9CRUS
MEDDFGETQVLIVWWSITPTWQPRNMPCSIGLKSRCRKKSVFFWKNCPFATIMLPRYCLFALSVFREMEIAELIFLAPIYLKRL